jgi:hypothetical protein
LTAIGISGVYRWWRAVYRDFHGIKLEQPEEEEEQDSEEEKQQEQNEDLEFGVRNRDKGLRQQLIEENSSS